MSVQQMLTDLIEAGYSQSEIAQVCNTTQPTISRAALGASVRYETGKCIEKLHKKAMKRSKQEVVCTTTRMIAATN